jgi:hypothetical protein
VPVPNLPGKVGLASVYNATDFVAHLRANGWNPEPLPEAVIYTYGGFDQLCAAMADDYTPNPMLGPGPGRFFTVNATDGRVAVCCMGIGGPAVVAQLEMHIALGMRRFLSIGTAGGLRVDDKVGDVVVLTGAVRDEGVSYHYLAADADAVPDAALTRALLAGLDSATTGTTWTIDAPFRQTAQEIASYRAQGVRAVEMEAASLFAAATARSVPLASAVVFDGVYGDPIGAPATDTAAAFGKLYDVFRASIAVLA